MLIINENSLGATPDAIDAEAFTIVLYTPVSILSRKCSAEIVSEIVLPPFVSIKNSKNTINITGKTFKFVLKRVNRIANNIKAIPKAKRATVIKLGCLSQILTIAIGPITINIGANMVINLDLVLSKFPTCFTNKSKVLFTAKKREVTSNAKIIENA